MLSNSNFVETNKPSSKVLRPPGGGSSDIFGAELPQTPRTVKNHMQSNIFSSDKNGAIKNNGDNPRRGQKNVDSYTRLFGEPERPITPAKNHMKSNIPFGVNTEAAQQLLTNGNGHHNHHTTNGKCGSVSSTSSSVSSSTENLKMNGASKTEVDPACPVPTPPVSETSSEVKTTLPIDLPCEDNKAGEPVDGNLSARSRMTEKTEDLSARSKASVRTNTAETDQQQQQTGRFKKIAGKADVGAGDVASQTRKDNGCNPDNPYSFSKPTPPSNKSEPLDPCVEKEKPPPPRNPITGCGLGEDGVGGIKPKKPKSRRDGNPVTGEGYKSNDMNNSIPSLNGANQVINKNRIPPGGFSSGLW